ncbi:protein daughter of sevenless [Toxorhynchites rutilus septentrionalis]|uniref:protein daughter of sevenless n=1 Tax=Toxorhynchites rutilus septentrionalis TaxID=329112 RepID=UPI002479AC1A|nr:protein daughter of sevenless [Toxorhynchites rutilus septentrionalis]
MTANKEAYHEGWLIKSPPTKRIWRARWRRRWFTLKQGELPGQYFLEYYTDRKCRKLKGIIDLDQCEQVDAGLRLDRQKEKYAHMFDVKTPTRTYYLAADTEADMRGWVECICQVCNLQETQTVDDRPYHNIGAIAMAEGGSNTTGHGSIMDQQDESNATVITMLNTSMVGDTQEQQPSVQQQQPQPRQSLMSSYNPYGTYQNEEVMNLRGTEYSNRETIICEAKLNQNQTMRNTNAEAYSNLGTIERSQSLRGKPNSPEKANSGHLSLVNHTRTQSLNTDQKFNTSTPANSGKKIPENLKLGERSVGFESGPEQPSPALSNSSGPYIPISECFSGSPMLHSPITPLNSLDPRFYDTPRSHTNIGFNLVSNEQPYSPKRNNLGGAGVITSANSGSICSKATRSGKSSPSDSESVFTDDEWTASSAAEAPRTKDRNTRPSDSSIENDTIGWTYVQRFAKVAQDEQESVASVATAPPPRPPKRTSLILESIDRHKDIQSSDTENASPAIGPKDASSCVEEFYDLPRSHQPSQYSGSNMHLSEADLLSSLSQCDLVASSTPNLSSEVGSQCGTLGRIRPHCYSNAAPQRVEGNVFRFDFSEQGDAPAINRNLKPKSTVDITKSVESVAHGVKQVNSSVVAPTSVGTPGTLTKPPPTVDRTRKPTTPKIGTNSMRRKGGPVLLNIQNNNENVYGNTQDHGTQHFSGIMPRTPGKNDDRLQYLDLDHSNSPQKSHALNHHTGSGTHSSTALASNTATNHTGPSATAGGGNSLAPPVIARTPYTTVDFVKTDAFNRIRADSEMNRNQSRLKDQS